MFYESKDYACIIHQYISSAYLRAREITFVEQVNEWMLLRIDMEKHWGGERDVKWQESACNKKWPLTPVFLPGKSHGWRSLTGCRKESDTTERLTLHYIAVVKLLRHVRLFATSWPAALQASLSFSVSRSLLRFMSIESVMPSKHLIFCHPLFLLPSIFPSISIILPSIFPSSSHVMSRLFTSGGQSIGASASAAVLPMNIQDLSPKLRSKIYFT